MRDRHFPRLCRACHSPMARQEDMCWHCGIRWASEDGAPTKLQTIAGGKNETLADADRWANEDRRMAPKSPALPRAVAGSG